MEQGLLRPPPLGIVLVTVVQVAVPAGEVAARYLNPQTVSGEKDVAGGPQIHLYSPQLVRARVQATDPVADGERATVWMDVAQPGHPVGRWRRARDVEE